MTRPISEYRQEVATFGSESQMESREILLEALDELEQAREHVRVLREALEKYAPEDNWTFYDWWGFVPGPGADYERITEVDPGHWARSALAATAPKEGTP